MTFEELINAYNDMLNRMGNKNGLVDLAARTGAEVFVNRLFANKLSDIKVYEEFLEGIQQNGT